MKVFDYNARARELIREGVPEEEAVNILKKESDEADTIVLNDGAWFGLIDELIEEIEGEYQQSNE